MVKKRKALIRKMCFFLSQKKGLSMKLYFTTTNTTILIINAIAIKDYYFNVAHSQYYSSDLNY